MHTGAPLKGGPQLADSWTTNPLNPHRIRGSRLAAEIELFRELEEHAEDAELTCAFRAAREFTEDLQDARIEFCMLAPPGTLIEEELLALERLSPWGGAGEFDSGEYVRVLWRDGTALERARGAYLRAVEDAHKAYADVFRRL